MKNSRINSLQSINISNWRWKSFLDEAIKELSKFELDLYPISPEFLDKEVDFGSKVKSISVKTSTWACKTNRIRQVRASCIEAKGIISVLNLLITPYSDFDLPFLGADFVTLPTGHLLALDLQPALKNDIQHTEKVWNKLVPLHRKWANFLPSGGPIPKSAKPFFSPGFLWTRIPLGIEGDQIISNIIKPAFCEYISLFMNFLVNAEKVSHSRSLRILNGQKNYMKYRAEKDPARAMLTRFYGEEWTEDYINNVLFDLQ